MVKKGASDILVTLNIVTAQQMEQCAAQPADGRTVEQCLIDAKVTTAEDIAKAYATYASLDYVEKISDKMADLNLLSKVPLKFLRDNAVMPVVIDGNVIILTANPFNFQPIDDLILILGGDIKTAIATPKVISDAINRYYPIEGTKQMMEELEEEKDELGTVDFEGVDEKDIMR